MIAKIGIGDNLYGVLAYNYEKLQQGEAKILATQKLSAPLSGALSLGACYRDFEKALPQKMRCKSPILHISLNPHPDDKLSDEQLEQIGKEYLCELGYGKQPFVIFKHEDIAREHIHIVSLRVDTNGKKINDAFEHRRSKQITDKLEEKYQLKRKSERETLGFEQAKKADIEKANVKKQIAGVVRPLIQSYRFQSMGEWNALLSLYNVKAEELKSEHRVQAFTGILYSITDEKGEKRSVPVKSSRIGKSVGAKTLQKHFEQSKAFLKENHTSKERLKNVIIQVMQFSPDKTEFIADLRAEGVGVLFRENEVRRIYGMTLIDHKEQTVMNGSHLGKNFAANIFNEYFNGNGHNPFLGAISYKEDLQQQLSSIKTTIKENEEETLFETLLPDEAGLLDGLPVHGIDYKELAFIRKMRRLHSDKKRGRKQH